MALAWNEKELARVFQSPAGPTVKMLARKAVAVEAEVKRSLKRPGTGRLYRKSNPQRVHRASAPGQPPATDLGSYGASITHAIGTDRNGPFAWVGTNDRRGPMLERGTIRIKPRPHFRPALRVLRTTR